MNIQNVLFRFMPLLALAVTVGCSQSPTGAVQVPELETADQFLKVHWMGKKKLGLEAGAYYFNRMWDLPETKRLQAQTLDKLAIAPWRLIGEPNQWTNIPVGVFRPLLDDIIQEQVLIRARSPSNRTAELVFAIKLPSTRGGLWETNLAVTVQSLLGDWPQRSEASKGWILERAAAPKRIELTRVGNWTLLGVAGGENELLKHARRNAAQYDTPFSSSSSNFWLEIEVNAGRIPEGLPFKQMISGADRFRFAANGDGANVITRGSLDFTNPLGVELDAWNIPTNIIREPLASFAAVRGVRGLLSPMKALDGLVPLPNQVYVWSLDGSVSQTYAAASWPDIARVADRLGKVLTGPVNAWLATRSPVGFQPITEIRGFALNGVPSLPVFMVPLDLSGGVFYAGTAPDTGGATNPVASSAMLYDVVRRTNLVCYEWEMTRPRIVGNLFLGQTARDATRYSQLPLESAAAIWLNALMPRVDSCTTVITLPQPNRLEVLRKSTLGLSSAELNLLADWLESPDFPSGLHSTRAHKYAAPQNLQQ